MEVSDGSNDILFIFQLPLVHICTHGDAIHLPSKKARNNCIILFFLTNDPSGVSEALLL